MKQHLLIITLFLSIHCYSKPLRDNESDKTDVTTMIRDIKFGRLNINAAQEHLSRSKNFLYGTLFHEAICQNAWQVCYTFLDFIKDEKLSEKNLQSYDPEINHTLFLHQLIRSKAPYLLIEEYVTLFPKSKEKKDDTVNKLLPIKIAIEQSDNSFLAKLLVPKEIDSNLINFAKNNNRPTIAALLTIKKEKQETQNPGSQKPSSQGSAADTDQQAKRPNFNE